MTALGSDAGVSHNTANAWLSVLESSFLCFRLPAWHRNVRKQLVKAPKLHFFDSGLLCYLLGIREPSQLRHHPLRGPIFESRVVSEYCKQQIDCLIAAAASRANVPVLPADADFARLARYTSLQVDPL